MRVHPGKGVQEGGKMEKVKRLLEAKLAQRLEGVLEDVLEQALEGVLNRLLGVDEVTPHEVQATVTTTTPAKAEVKAQAEPPRVRRNKATPPDTRIRALALRLFPYERRPLEDITAILTRRYASLEKSHPNLGELYLGELERMELKEAVQVYKLGRIDLERRLLGVDLEGGDA